MIFGYIYDNVSFMSKKVKVARNNEEKIYEIGYHLISSISEENLPKEVEKIKDYLAKEKAAIISEGNASLRPLAYPIKKAFQGTYKVFDKAYFGFIKFEMGEGGDITKIDEKLKNNENVLRYIIVNTVRENTMYSPKISVFRDSENKKPIVVKTEKSKTEAPASIEEIDKSIDELIGEEVKI